MSDHLDTTSGYRTVRNNLHRNCALYRYADELTDNITPLWNRVNFIIRQLYTGLAKKPEERYDNENDIINLVQKWVHKNNWRRKQAGKEPLDIVFDETHKYIAYETLNMILQLTNDPVYRAVPSQTAQQTINEVIEAWESFFGALSSYKEDPSKFKARPQIPQYKKHGVKSTATITNQQALIKECKNGTKYLQVPRTKTKKLTKYWLGGKDYLPEGGTLSEVRFVPNHGHITLEMVFKVYRTTVVKGCRTRIAGIDLGLDNLVALVTNLGIRPILIKGGSVKSINQYFNKMTSHYKSLLPEGAYNSHRIDDLWFKRGNCLDDWMHKVSRWIANWCANNDIDCLVVGYNEGWKQDVELGKKTNQNFCCIPYSRFVSLIEYKCDELGIEVVKQEESYTSKASFLDCDPIPVYGEEGADKVVFSGKRIHRGLYQSADGTLINADVNGGCNVIIKVIPTAFDYFEARGCSGVVDAPVVAEVPGTGVRNNIECSVITHEAARVSKPIAQSCADELETPAS